MNIQGDITKTRDLLSQAVQYLDQVTNANNGNRSTDSKTQVLPALVTIISLEMKINIGVCSLVGMAEAEVS